MLKFIRNLFKGEEDNAIYLMLAVVQHRKITTKNGLVVYTKTITSEDWLKNYC